MNTNEEYQEFRTEDAELDFVLNNYQRLSRWKKASIHLLFFRFACDSFAKEPTLFNLRFHVWATFKIMVWPDVVYFGLPCLFALSAIIAWAGAMATGNAALLIACLSLAAIAYLKRPAFNSRKL